MRLQGKVALVTGTSANIGGGIAEVLAEHGASLVCVDAMERNAKACAAAIVATGGRAVAVTCDVTDEDQVKAAVSAATEAFGGLDILVNNAAIFNKKGVIDMPVAEWRRQVDIILTGAFLFTKFGAAAMIEGARRGAIINIVSTAGHQGEPGNVAYSTAKGGLLNFTRSTAMELVGRGIRVNSVTPTATDPLEAIARAERWGSEMSLPAGWEGRIENYRRGIPMQKLPTPRDYGQAVAFLASDDAAMITGEDLRVDAGAVARYWAWNPEKR
ncbi:SDR family NAD(P)-dependent oxidoreductase [Sphingoaurantiacus capsulatus]|uniref:SDR family NAD(P)-dependent oxidoreductase n=1 Tax=Sphingoaurantiacus capsulatus TaxID=1771310 RepID=A0ABV7X9A2_9SPHN